MIKVAKRIFNSDKICRSYSDLNFGVTFLEHSVHDIPVWTVACVVLVIRVDEESSLIEQVLASGHVAHGDDGKSHLTCPRVHDVSDVVAVSGGVLEGLPQLRHFRVAELELADVALTQAQRRQQHSKVTTARTISLSLITSILPAQLTCLFQQQ